MIFIILLIIATIAIALTLLLTLEIETKIIFKNGKNYSFIVVRLLRGILRLRINLSFKKVNEGLSLILRKTDSSFDKATSFEEVFKLFKKNYKSILENSGAGRYILSKVKISNISLDLEFGTGDAAQTAIISGAIIFIFSTIQSYIRNRYSLSPQALKVLPHFERKAFNMDLNCIIHLRIGHIIIAGTRIIGKKLKGGERNGRTSY